MAITITLGSGITSYTENATTLLFSTASVSGSGPDSDKIDSITIALTNNAATRSLSLNATATSTASSASVTASYSTSTGILTLSSVSNVTNANWRTILSGVQYTDTSDNPTSPGNITVTATNTLPTGTGSNTLTAFTIVQANDAPTATALVDQAVRFDNALSYNASSAFSDVDNASLTYSAAISGGAALSTIGLSINSSTGVISGTPTFDKRGTYTLNVTASDGSLSAATTVRIAITEFQAGVLLIGTNGGETLTGNTSNDTASYVLAASAVTASLASGSATGGGGTDTLSGIENIICSTFNDNLTGNDSANSFDGLDGNDSITAGGGNDILIGGFGTDTLIGGAGNDIYVIDNSGGTDDTITEQPGEGTDIIYTNATLGAMPANVENLTLTGGALNIDATGNTSSNRIIGNDGNNTISGGDDNDELQGRNGNDTLNGENGNDNLIGGSGNDNLNGGPGNDILSGGAGQDTETGGTGNDTYEVDNVSDSVIESSGGGTDIVKSSITFVLPANVEKLTLTGTSSINGTGNGLNNVIIGNAGNNELIGGDGKDVLYGWAGTNTLTGGAGQDIFKFTSAGSHTDTITDYNVTDDTIHLDNAIYTSLTVLGTLNATQFKIGTTAIDSDDFVIYNSGSGELLYDADGSSGGAAVLIATLSIGFSMTNADMIVI